MTTSDEFEGVPDDAILAGIAESVAFDQVLDVVGQPSDAERVGLYLATRLDEASPQAVMAWEDAASVQIAHVVARELGVHVVKAFDEEGLVAWEGPLSDARRIVVVADAFRDETSVNAMLELAMQKQISIAGAGAATKLGSDAERALEKSGVVLVHIGSAVDVGPAEADEANERE